jgi:hypothetical protein
VPPLFCLNESRLWFQEFSRPHGREGSHLSSDDRACGKVRGAHNRYARIVDDEGQLPSDVVGDDPEESLGEKLHYDPFGSQKQAKSAWQ